VWDRGLECGMFVPVTVMVVHTTTCRGVASRQVRVDDARSVLVCGPGRAGHARQSAHTTVTRQPARTEARVATPVVALRVRLLER